MIENRRQCVIQRITPPVPVGEKDRKRRHTAHKHNKRDARPETFQDGRSFRQDEYHKKRRQEIEREPAGVDRTHVAGNAMITVDKYRDDRSGRHNFL